MTVRSAADRDSLSKRWFILAAGMAAQMAMAALQQGLPVLGPVMREVYGLSLPELGALLASVSWGSVFSLVLWGLLADRFGERVVVSFGLCVSVALLVVATGLSRPLALGLCLALAGAMSASAIGGSGRAVMGWFGREERGLALGLRQMSVPLGASLAAMILPWAVAVGGMAGAYLALAGISLAGAVASLFFLLPPPEPATPRPAATGPTPLRDPSIWRLSTAAGLMMWAQAGLATFVIVLMVEVHHLSTATAAAIFIAIQIAGGALRILSGVVSDRRGLRVPHLRRYAAALTVALVLAACLNGEGAVPATAALTLATVLSVGWNGLATTSVAEFAGYARAGSALGMHGSVIRAVSAPAGYAFGLVVDAAGWGPGLLILALGPALAAILWRASQVEELRRGETEIAARPARRPA